MTAAVDYSYLRQVVFRESRNVLDASHDYLFETRLSRLLQRHGMTRLEELVNRLRLGQPALERAVAEAMTINETSFFRDLRIFDVLRNDLIPRLIQSRSGSRKLRIWSAASSTGQEAYSIAMMLREHFPHLASWDIRIEGTDISASVVQRAQTGRYHRIEMNRGLPARLLVRYFDRIDDEWIIKPEIAALCTFRQGNLCLPLPFYQPFDIVLLRNVMIYFSNETRRSVLEGVRRLVASDGYLILGTAEQPAEPSKWTTVLTGGACYFQPREAPALGGKPS